MYTRGALWGYGVYLRTQAQHVGNSPRSEKGTRGGPAILTPFCDISAKHAIENIGSGLTAPRTVPQPSAPIRYSHGLYERYLRALVRQILLMARVSGHAGKQWPMAEMAVSSQILQSPLLSDRCQLETTRVYRTVN